MMGFLFLFWQRGSDIQRLSIKVRMRNFFGKTARKNVRACKSEHSGEVGMLQQNIGKSLRWPKYLGVSVTLALTACVHQRQDDSEVSRRVFNSWERHQSF